MCRTDYIDVNEWPYQRTKYLRMPAAAKIASANPIN